jgi:hypothetical protein
VNRVLVALVATVLASTVVVAVGACGGTTPGSPVDASTMDGVDATAPETSVPGMEAGVDAGSDAAETSCPSAPFGCGFDAGCPATLPAAGSACDTSPEFGCHAPAPGTDECTAEFACQDGGWAILDLPEAGTSCAYVLPAGCPATFAAAFAQVGQSCSAPQMACSYDQGTCGCPIVDVDAGTGVWACIMPAADSGCPVDAPKGRALCTAPLVCPYGNLCGGPLGGSVMMCGCCGIWVPELPPPCPPPGP